MPDDVRIFLYHAAFTDTTALVTVDKGRVLTAVLTVSVSIVSSRTHLSRCPAAFRFKLRQCRRWRCEIYCIWRHFYIYDGYRERELST
jgi:hypothetical protein